MAKEKQKKETPTKKTGETPKAKGTAKKKPSLREQLEKASAELAEYQDKLLRLTAEFDNHRKRTFKEKSDLLKSAQGDLIAQFLPVIDDVDRAMENTSTCEDVASLREGLKLIHSKFQEFIQQCGIKEIEALEQVLDVDEHEAIAKIPAPKEELKGKVVDVVKKGYTLNGNVIRFAQVVVGE